MKPKKARHTARVDVPPGHGKGSFYDDKVLRDMAKHLASVGRKVVMEDLYRAFKAGKTKWCPRCKEWRHPLAYVIGTPYRAEGCAVCHQALGTLGALEFKRKPPQYYFATLPSRGAKGWYGPWIGGVPEIWAALNAVWPCDRDVPQDFDFELAEARKAKSPEEFRAAIRDTAPRTKYGKRTPLTEELVYKMAELRDKGLSTKAIGLECRVDYTTVRRLLSGLKDFTL